jgi:hypothetical protein
MRQLMRNFLAGCVVVSLAAGTGCSEPDTLTCEWLAMADNCWKTTARAAVSCLPPEADRGMLSADNATCTYPGGQVATFNPPVDLLGDDDPVQNFTITDANGSACVQWQEIGDSGFALTVNGSQTFRETTSGFAIDVTCPDGTKFHNGNALDLLSCDTGLFGLPGQASGWTDTSVSNSLIGVEPSVAIFDCSKS